MKKLVLIDGHALVHRAFHALPPTLSSPTGVPTNAVFGFTSVLLKMIKDLKPDYIAATFDLAAPTFRHEEFAEYKAHREKAPDELYIQVPLVKEILVAFGIPIYEKPGFEADDLIGALAERAKKNKDIQTIITTGDLDTLQLVDDKKVVVFTLRKGVTDAIIYDEDEVFKRYGLKPEQLNDFKGLKGDPSDNIPGVPGVGEKTAAMLIQKFGNLEKLYESIVEIKSPIQNKPGLDSSRRGGRGSPNQTWRHKSSLKTDLPLAGKSKIKELSEKLIQKLLEHKDIAFFSKKLATIVRSVDLDFDLNKADWTKHLNRAEIEKMFKELGLYSLIKRLEELDIITQEQIVLPKTAVAKDVPIKEIKSKRAISEILATVKQEKKMVFDLSGGFLNVKLHDMCYSISWPVIFETKALFGVLKDIFEGKDVFKIGHDLKEIAKFLLGYRMELDNHGFDTKLAAYLLNSDRKHYDLDKIYFNEFQKNTDPDRRAAPFFIEKLKKNLSEHLEKEKLKWLFDNIEVPTAKILAEMELRGVLIDTKAIAKLSTSITKQISDLETEIYKLIGAEFNINSPQQISEVLFDKLGLRGRIRKTTKGALSTAASELEKLSEEHPVVDLILKYREVQKLKTTYIDPFPSLISRSTGRLHTTFNQTGTTTGRLASQNPNLQNIPIRTGLGQEFRKVFIASPGYKLVSFDYSQIELRVAAHISQDEKMIGAFKRGEDIHTRTAAEIFGVKPELVDKNMRRDAKVLNFGVLYGMGILGFQRASGVSREKARDFIDRYMKEFSGIAKYMNDMKMKVRKDGYVTTIFGRRRWLPGIRSSMPQVVSQAERMAINHPIQGTATGDLMKLAMIKSFEYIHDSGYKDDVFLLIQVHDELLFEIKKDLVANLSVKIKDIMENLHKLDVPLTVDVKYGNNWAEMDELRVA